MRSWKFLLPFLASTLCLAAQPDRLAGPIDSAQKMPLTGNVHGFAQPRFEIGRTDGSMVLHGVTIAFRPSAAQQADLNNLLAQLQDSKSPNYHKWLTPAQFADRFGMSQNDILHVSEWLESQGLTVVLVANSRNQISFEGTVGQIEAVFNTEIHDYLVNGEIHFANATNPSVPAALAPSVLSVGHLHNFNPKPRAIFRRASSAADPHFTSHISGDHFLTPADFATIYDIQSLYNSGIDGTGQKIAITGQSSINLADISNFRSAAGLVANAPTLLLMPGTGTSSRCSGDEGESDLDAEWSAGVAKNASVTLVFAGLASGDTCTSRQFGAFDALQYAIDQNVAPIISNSYGNCESALGTTFVQTMQGWMQQANAQGQTVISASGDTGAADCEPSQSTSATTGPAVDIPAAIPEVTGMGGTEFNGDAEATVTNGNATPTSFWSGTTGGNDAISSALSYIPEMAWNDTSNSANTTKEILASGGGTSTIFPKPSWQTGHTPNDTHRDVPDLALNASPDHDPYLYCSEDGANDTIVATCTSGFRDSSLNLAAVGGTSAAAPTFSAIIALLNQQLGTFGLGNINPNLYSLAASNPAAFNDITTGNNIVPCTQGSKGCPTSSPFQFGFTTGHGYDQVTGLGSVNASVLFSAWPATRGPSSVVISSSASTVNAGTSVTFTAKVTATTGAGVGTVSFSTINNAKTLALGAATLNTGTATFTTTALPAGNNSVTATYEGDASDNASTSNPAAVTVSDFTLSVATALSPSTISAGQLASATLTLTPVNGSTQTINFVNSLGGSIPGSCAAGLPTGALCAFSPTSVTLDGTHSVNVTLTVSTAPNMALGTDSITVTGTASGTGGSSHSAPVSLTVTATTESFTLATTNGATFGVPVGGTAAVQFSISSTTGFVNSVSSTTNIPLNYTCSGIPNPALITCQFTPNNGQSITATAVTLNLVTTPKTVQLIRPFQRSRGIFYALLLPGLIGIVFVGGPGRRLRRITSLMLLSFCTLWLGACGGGASSVPKNAGTPPATYTVTVSASTGGANPLTATAPTITLTVTP